MNIRLFTGRGKHRNTETPDPVLTQQLAAMEVIDRLTADNNQLAAVHQQAVQWATDAELVVACLDRQNRELRAENERLRRELAGYTRPVARVIPLYQRHSTGPDAA